MYILYILCIITRCIDIISILILTIKRLKDCLCIDYDNYN